MYILHKQTQKLLSTEGFANNELNKWLLWALADNLLWTIPASTQRGQDEGIKENKAQWKIGGNRLMNWAESWWKKGIKVNAPQKLRGREMRKERRGKTRKICQWTGSGDRQGENENCRKGVTLKMCVKKQQLCSSGGGGGCGTSVSQLKQFSDF